MTALTTAGANFLAQATINDSSPVFFASGSTCYLGVGSSTTAFSIAQTDLVTPLTNPRAVATVTRATGVLTFIASFGTTFGNGVWAEIGIFNALSGGTMLARKVESPDLGTKLNTQVWTLTVTATYTAT